MPSCVKHCCSDSLLYNRILHQNHPTAWHEKKWKRLHCCWSFQKCPDASHEVSKHPNNHWSTPLGARLGSSVPAACPLACPGATSSLFGGSLSLICCLCRLPTLSAVCSIVSRIALSRQLAGRCHAAATATFAVAVVRFHIPQDSCASHVGCFAKSTTTSQSP